MGTTRATGSGRTRAERDRARTGHGGAIRCLPGCSTAGARWAAGNCGSGPDARGRAMPQTALRRDGPSGVGIGDLGQAMLGEQVVEGLAEQRLDGGVGVGCETAQQAADLRREIAGDADLAEAAGLRLAGRVGDGIRGGIAGAAARARLAAEPRPAWPRFARRRSADLAVIVMGIPARGSVGSTASGQADFPASGQVDLRAGGQAGGVPDDVVDGGDLGRRLAARLTPASWRLWGHSRAVGRAGKRRTSCDCAGWCGASLK